MGAPRPAHVFGLTWGRSRGSAPTGGPDFCPGQRKIGVCRGLDLIASEIMPAEANPESASPAAALSPAMEEAAKRLYRQANAARFGISPERFLRILAEVISKATAANAKAAFTVGSDHAGTGEAEALELLGLLRVEELVLARACSAGNAAAWDEFLNRYRAKLYEAALGIAHDEASARELADGLYAELYGLPSTSGVRASKLASYMGRGSLEGWLRTVLAQAYVDRYRAQKRTVSLEEQMEAGASFAASSAAAAPAPDARPREGYRVGARHPRRRGEVPAGGVFPGWTNLGRAWPATARARVHHQPQARADYPRAAQGHSPATAGARHEPRAGRRMPAAGRRPRSQN